MYYISRNYMLTGVVAILLAIVPLRAAEEAFFLVAELTPPLEQGFLLRLTKAEDIAHARYLAAIVPTGEKAIDRALVGATIAKGSDGLNRNYCAAGAPRWSWHISEFHGFFDYSAEVLDGTPIFLEKNLDGWMSMNDGLIGFWGYTVVAEIEPPLVVSPQLTEEGAEISWLNRGTNYVYTVEVSTSFQTPNWAPAEGQAWPTSETNWVDKSFSPASPPRMYRVRAEEMN